MLARALLHVTGLLLSLVDWAIGRVVDALEGLGRLWGLIPLRRWYRRLLEVADHWLSAGKAYLQAVGARLRCRMAYENVAAALKERYRRLRDRD
jgi:hypothetical protein